MKNEEKKLEKELKNASILIVGGGSIGSQLAKKLLEYPIHSIRILDIDEYALFKIKKNLNDNRIRYLLGNILDKDRVYLAMKDVDIVIHTAAIKNIEISEFNPIETIEVNINGTVNLIKKSMELYPKKFLYISTDKAAEPSTLYGTTKQIGERLVSWAGSHNVKTKYGTIRFGNVFETRGNALEIWREQKNEKIPLTITEPNMERYYFHMDEAIDFILECIIKTNRGEIFVPKMKSYLIKELASKISDRHKIIGIRQGEKIKEVLITESEKENAKENKNMWIITQYKK
jgi:UDP-N-acetylglucosamine 4,6-dehydratase/5-epimerase